MIHVNQSRRAGEAGAAQQNLQEWNEAMDEIDVFALPTHQACEIWPWLDDERMELLVESIRECGLRMPLVIGRVDGEWMLIDGKNRREACRRLGVVPHFVVADGDPLARIFSENYYRRHLTTGQLAMAASGFFPDADSGGRGHKSKFLEDYEGKERKVFQEAVRKARIVRRHAPCMVDRVRDGMLTLDAAFQTANENYQAQRRHAAQVEMLKRRAPDLLTRVGDNELSHQEAQAICEERERERKELRAKTFRTFIHLLHAVQQAADRLDNVAGIPLVMDDPDYYAKFRDIGGCFSFEVEIERQLETVLTTAQQVTAQLRQWRRNRKITTAEVR